MDPLKWFEEFKLVAVIRSSSADDAEEMIKASMSGGFRLLEISVQTPQAFRLLESYSKREDVFVGAGGVVDGEIAHRAIRSGAQFISTPYTERDVVSVAKNNDCFVIQGAFTATEIVNAYQIGADLVMVYPSGFAGGPQYLKSLKSLLPQLKLVAGGGITLEVLNDYLRESLAVFLKDALFERPLVRTDNWAEITERAKQFSEKLEILKVSK